MPEENVKIVIEFETEETKAEETKEVKEKKVDDEGSKDVKKIKEKREQTTVNETVGAFKSGNVGEIQKLAQSQYSNIQQLAKNPAGFFVSLLNKKLIKGGLILAFIIFIKEIIIDVIKSFFLDPGKPLDPRFKRKIQDEVLGIISQRDKEELRKGTKSVIVTTRQGLRGGEGKVSGNLYHPQSIPGNFLRKRPVVVVDNDRAAGLTRGQSRYRR